MNVPYFYNGVFFWPVTPYICVNFSGSAMTSRVEMAKLQQESCPVPVSWWCGKYFTHCLWECPQEFEDVLGLNNHLETWTRQFNWDWYLSFLDGLQVCHPKMVLTLALIIYAVCWTVLIERKTLYQIVFTSRWNFTHQNLNIAILLQGKLGCDVWKKTGGKGEEE